MKTKLGEQFFAENFLGENIFNQPSSVYFFLTFSTTVFCIRVLEVVVATPRMLMWMEILWMVDRVVVDLMVILVDQVMEIVLQ